MSTTSTPPVGAPVRRTRAPPVQVPRTHTPRDRCAVQRAQRNGQHAFQAAVVAGVSTGRPTGPSAAAGVQHASWRVVCVCVSVCVRVRVRVCLLYVHTSIYIYTYTHMTPRAGGWARQAAGPERSSPTPRRGRRARRRFRSSRRSTARRYGWARSGPAPYRCHICTGTGLIPATSALGIGLGPATSAPGLGSSLPHLHSGLGSALPHLRRDRARPLPHPHLSHPLPHLRRDLALGQGALNLKTWVDHFLFGVDGSMACFIGDTQSIPIESNFYTCVRPAGPGSRAASSTCALPERISFCVESLHAQSLRRRDREQWNSTGGWRERAVLGGLFVCLFVCLFVFIWLVVCLLDCMLACLLAVR